MRPIVADASILIHLARANSFSLLNLQYENLIIATGVYVEVVERGWGLPGSMETENAINTGWLEVQRVENKAKVLELIQSHAISLGNAETIQLAIEQKAILVLVDEIAVRNLLELQQIPVRGCIGAVIEAARKHRIHTEEARTIIQRLVETGYRVDNKVLMRADQLLGDDHGEQHSPDD